MSNTPPPSGFQPGPVPQMPWPPAPPRGAARWPVAVMFAITLVAAAAAVAAWLRPMPDAKAAIPSAPSFSAQQVVDAKAKVCGAYEKVKKASNMNAARNGGDDPNAQLLVAVNGRQVYVASSLYLLTTLIDAPATSTDLAVQAKKLANLFQTIAIEGLASDPSLAAHDAVNETGTTLDSLCK